MTVTLERPADIGPVIIDGHTVILESAEENWAAFSPTIPGCIATGADRAETIENFRGALAAHIALLRDEGLPLPEPPNGPTFGQELRRCRDEIGLTQRALAEMIGRPQSMIARIEKGVAPELGTIQLIAAALGVTICVAPNGSVKITLN